jgi:hypothetical protein
MATDLNSKILSEHFDLEVIYIVNIGHISRQLNAILHWGSPLEETRLVN